METTFIYNGKIISTPNLEKKLKRMKISIDDIEIIDKPFIKKENDNLLIPLENYHIYKYPDGKRFHLVITDSPKDTITFNNEVLTYEIDYIQFIERNS